MSEELFHDVAADPGKLKHRRQLLEKLASNTKNKAVAEMARDLLKGRTAPRQIMADGGYHEEFNKGTAKFASWYGKLSEEEREAVCRQERERLDELATEPDPESAAPPAPRPQPDTADEDNSELNWLE